MPPPPTPLANPPSSSKKRKFDDLNRPSQILPPNGSTLYLALYAPTPSKQMSSGLLEHDWAFLLAPNAEPDTHGRQYRMREISPNVLAGNGPGPYQASGTTARGLSDLAREQQRRRFLRLLAAPSQQSRHHLAQDAHRTSSLWELEIQDVPMWSTGCARVRIQLSRVQDVEMFEALIKDIYLESDESKGVEWHRVSWMADAWAALVEVGHDVLVLPGGGGKSEDAAVPWQTVQETAMWFVEAVEREGKFEEDEGDPRGRVVPTWGLLERRLLVS